MKPSPIHSQIKVNYNAYHKKLNSKHIATRNNINLTGHINNCNNNNKSNPLARGVDPIWAPQETNKNVKLPRCPIYDNILYIHWTYYMYIHIYHDVSIYDMCCFLSQAGKSRLEHNENVFSLNGGLMLPRWGIFVDCVLMNLEVSIFRTLTTTTSWTNIWQESVIDGWFDDVSSGAKNGITQPWYTNHSFSDPNFPLQIAHP